MIVLKNKKNIKIKIFNNNYQQLRKNKGFCKLQEKKIKLKKLSPRNNLTTQLPTHSYKISTKIQLIASTTKISTLTNSNTP